MEAPPDVESGKAVKGPASLETARMMKKAREKEWVAERVRWQQICIRRAEVRNSFRRFVERSPRLAEFFGARYVPPVTANQINLEEEERRQTRARKLAHLEKDVWPGETLEFIANPEIYVDDETMRKSEYVKHMGSKFALCLERGEFREARRIVDEVRKRAKDDKLREFLEEELVFRLARFYSGCIAEGDSGAIMEAFMEMGEAVKIARDDLVDVKDCVLRDKEFLRKIARQMAGLKAASPDLFGRMKKYFECMGLCADKELE